MHSTLNLALQSCDQMVDPDLIQATISSLCLQVASAEAYEGVLAREGITLAVADRTEAIWRDVCEAAAKV